MMFKRTGILNFGLVVFGVVFGFPIWAQTINLDLTQSFQAIDRWENGCFLPSGLNAYVMDDLVDLTVDTLRVNRLRLEVRSGTEHPDDNYQLYSDSTIDYNTWRSLRYATVNDNDDPFDINWAGFHFTELDERIEDILIPIRNRLIENGSDLYINLCFVAFTAQLNDGAGGTIIHQDPEEYAEFIQAVFIHMESTYGFVPDGVEIILEPNVADFGNGTLVGQCLVATGDRLSGLGYNPDYIACSNTNLNGAINFYPSFSAVPGVEEYWSEYSFHAYAGRTDDNLIQIASNAAESGVKTSMLEWWANGNTYRFLHDCLKLANLSTFQFKGSFGAVGNDWNNGLLKITENGTNDFSLELQRPTKYFRHYFKLLHPGAVRFEASSDMDQFDPVLFVNPDGHLVMNINALAGGTLSVQGLPPGTYRTITSLGDGKQEPNPYWEVSSVDTIQDGESMSVTIQDEGVVSIVQLSSIVNSTSLMKFEESGFKAYADRNTVVVEALRDEPIEDVQIFLLNGQSVGLHENINDRKVFIDVEGVSGQIVVIQVNGVYASKLFID